jgi:hypothetical protein
MEIGDEQGRHALASRCAVLIMAHPPHPPMIKTRFAPSPTGLRFSLEHLGRAPARFDASQLDRWQREPHRPQHPRRSVGMDESCGRRGAPEKMRPGFVEAIRGNALLPADALLGAGIVYGE